MVYCGRPSKGCDACRARKVKCDQATPSCQRCLKANRKCPGYRDQLSLLFRDQSNAVARKTKSLSSNFSSATSATPTPTPTPPSSVISSGDWETQTPATTDSENYRTLDRHDADELVLVRRAALKPAPIDRRQQALCYCLGSFSWLNGSLAAHNSGNSADTTVAQKAMMKGIVSVGMANLSRIGSRSKALKLSAQTEYYNALRFTNAALSHPTLATNDATLIAILFLSLYEIVTSKKPESVESFVRHTKGAIALLELRGESQLFGPESLPMFETMRNEIIVSCLMREHPIPPKLLVLSEKVASLPDRSPHAILSHTECVIVSQMINLRIEAQRKQDNAEADAAIVSRAIALEAELEKTFATLPVDYLPKINIIGPAQYFQHPTLHCEIFPLNGIYHDHRFFVHCATLNNYRYKRIHCIDTVMKFLERMTKRPGFVATPEFKALCRRYCDAARQVAQDICATVPYLCGFLDGKRDNGYLSSQMNPAGGFSLLFPLWSAVAVDGYGSATCRWIQTYFEIIGREIGIDQALALKQLVPVERGMTRFVDDL